MRSVVATVVTLCALVLTGCATVPRDYPKEASYALTNPDQTENGRKFTEFAGGHPGESAFHLLPSGVDGFIARAATADAAQRTLDVQYYIVHDGLTTRVLIDRLIKAADRGVRVRMLVDDTTSHGRDYNIARLSAHPNIQVRVFNALYGGRRGAVRRAFGMLGDLGRLHRRMHNKLWLADNIVGIVGGRNLGDEYFAARKGVNFADLDVIALGPIVAELSRSFDEYWNSRWAVPIEAFVPQRPSDADLIRARRALTDSIEEARARESEYVRRLYASRFLADLHDHKVPVVWANASAAWDDPEKIGTAGEPDDSLRMITRLRKLIGGVDRELLLISPYFIPGKEGVASLAALTGRGVRVTVLTNSLEASDVPAVHSGYAPYRVGMVKAGVQLYEMRASAGAARADTDRSLFIGSSSASLHTKAGVFDRRAVFIGSMNLDPRSQLWNTEVGVYVESPELADQLWDLAEVGLQPEHSYRVELTGQAADGSGGRLVWVTKEGGETRTYTSEPAGFWRRFSAWFSGLFVPEELL